MNNKGQVLVVFVIILPIILILLSLVIDLGLISIEKRKLDNNTYSALEYYLDNLDDTNVEAKVKDLLNENLKDIDITIFDSGEYVELTVTKKYNSIYNILKKNSDITIKYKGIKNNKKIIKG